MAASDFQAKRAELAKNLRKSLKPSRKAFLIIFGATFFITLFSSLHGLTEAWAWGIAGDLITINGLVLGFVLFGVTMLSSDTLAQRSLERTVKGAIYDMIGQAKENSSSNNSVKDWWKDADASITDAFYRAGFEMGYIIGSLERSLIFILCSIGLSLCLFGVNSSIIDIWYFNLIFIGLYFSSLFCFVYGVYSTQRVLFVLLEKSIKLRPKGSVETVEEILKDILKRRQAQGGL